MKKEEVKMVPKYKCVVEYLCPHCGAGCADHAPVVVGWDKR
jgi:hypothetical protein